MKVSNPNTNTWYSFYYNQCQVRFLTQFKFGIGLYDLDSLKPGKVNYLSIDIGFINIFWLIK